ncbi:hypothetical protein FOCC_FOCC000490 [Frankliniella occidentalis]|nr:hypothetical protein FOCC_FOCC000490 [Frankliniella occidentalis]
MAPSALGQGAEAPPHVLHRLGLPARPVLVVGVLLHVHGAQPLGLVDEGPLVRLGQQLPLGAQPLGDLRVVHLGVVLRHLAPLPPRPHHEGVHGPLDSVHVLVGLGGVVVVVGLLVVVLLVGRAQPVLRGHADGALVERAVVAQGAVAQRALQGALVAQGAVVAQRAVRRLHVVLVALVSTLVGALVGTLVAALMPALVRLVAHLRHGVLVVLLLQRRRQRRGLVLRLLLHVHVSVQRQVRRVAVHVQAVVRGHRRVQAASLEVRLHGQHIVLCVQLGSFTQQSQSTYFTPPPRVGSECARRALSVCRPADQQLISLVHLAEGLPFVGTKHKHVWLGLAWFREYDVVVALNSVNFSLHEIKQNKDKFLALRRMMKPNHTVLTLMPTN